MAGVGANNISQAQEAIDRHWMDQAFALSLECTPVDTAYCVGAVIVGSDGLELARGYSREDPDKKLHAEGAALAKVGGTLHRATIYSTLEPCSVRASSSESCAQLIIEKTGIVRVVYAVTEPLFLQNGQGGEVLRAAGLAVRVMPDGPHAGYAALFREINAVTFARFAAGEA